VGGWRARDRAAVSHDEIVEPHRFDLQQRFASRAFADRHHRDDGGDAEHDARTLSEVRSL